MAEVEQTAKAIDEMAKSLEDYARELRFLSGKMR